MAEHEARNATVTYRRCSICNEPCSQTAAIPGHLDCWWDHVELGIAELEHYLSNWAAFAAWEATATAFSAGAAHEGGQA